MNENTSQAETNGTGASASGLKVLETAAEWHWKIAAELSHPVIPEELKGQERLARLSGIRRQRERHLKFARVLSKAVVIKNKKKLAD